MLRVEEESEKEAEQIMKEGEENLIIDRDNEGRDQLRSPL